MTNDPNKPTQQSRYGGVSGGDDVYTPINDDLSFDVRDATSKRALFLLLGTVILLLILAVGLLKAYGTGTRGPDDPPRILADTSPYKSAPENPGGAQTPNQDKTVYDVVSGEQRNDDVILAPAAEEPIELVPTPNQATVIVKKPEPAAPNISPPVQLEPAPAPATSTYSSSQTTMNRSSGIIIGDSNYVVQVASLRSAEEASEGWASLNSRFGDLIPSGLYADILRADLGGRGVWHRLRVSGFASKV